MVEVNQFKSVDLSNRIRLNFDTEITKMDFP